MAVTLTLHNRAHGTSVKVRVPSLPGPGDPVTLSRAQTLRVRLALCARVGCSCGRSAASDWLIVGETRDGRITVLNPDLTYAGRAGEPHHPTHRGRTHRP